MVANWSVVLVISTFFFLSETHERSSRGFSTIWRFSRKTHKWLRSVFVFLLLTDRSLSVLGTPCFSNDFSQTSQSFSAPRPSFELFLLKDSVFLVAAYLQKCFLADSAVFSFFCFCCAVVDGGSDFLTLLQNVLRTLVYSLQYSRASRNSPRVESLRS